MTQEIVQGDIYRVIYNTVKDERKNVLVLSTGAEKANEYVKKFQDCAEIIIPATRLAINVHIDSTFFEEYEFVEEYELVDDIVIEEDDSE